MKSSPLVTAVIPTKNRADILSRAIDSVLNQSYKNIELIVVDDGSEDHTSDVIKQYQEKHRLVYLRNERSLGACRSRNSGIEKAKGEFIAGLDDDDEWHIDRISILLHYYDDSFACITSNDRMISSGKSVVWHKKAVITFDDLLYSNSVGNQVLARRERLIEVGGFDESLVAAQDYDLWIRLCEKYGPVKNVKTPLQNIYQDAQKERISNPQTQLKGYLSVYKKHKSKMNRDQKKYQLYNIRLAQGKISSVFEFIKWVPQKRLWKEMKRWVVNQTLLKT